MLYSEFIKGTGCRDTLISHELYKVIEAFYMDNDGVEKVYLFNLLKKFIDQEQHNISPLNKSEWDQIYTALCNEYDLLKFQMLGAHTSEERRILDCLIDKNLDLRTKLAEPKRYGNGL